MRASDRGIGPLPARTTGPEALPSATPTSPTVATGRGTWAPRVVPTGRRKSPARLVGRALRRYWWQAFSLWLAGSAVLMGLIHDRGGPAFVAASTLAIRPGRPGIAPEDQARRITGPDVIAPALSDHPELLKFPRLAGGRDPGAAIRETLTASTGPGPDSVRVSAAGDSPAEATAILDAVVAAYLKTSREADEREAQARIRGLREAVEGRSAEVARRREAVTRMVEKVGSVDADRARDRDSKAAEAYGVLTRELLRSDLELIEARASVDRIRSEPIGSAPVDPTDPDGEVVAAFYADPRVADLQARLERIRAGRNSPERAASKGKVEEIQSRIDALWAELKPGLVAASSRRPGGREAEAKAAESRARGLEARMAELARRLEQLNAQTRSAGLDELALEFARQDLGRAEAVLDALSRSEPEAPGPSSTPRIGGPPLVSRSPGAELRRIGMVAVPASMFLAVLALVGLVEARGGRISDAEDVPGRLRLEVLGVIPPLPGSRAGSRQGARARREVGRFVQGLDHLRVAIRSGPDVRGRPVKSLVITSARKGEGKTTLAAQLAERSVNAGLLTLLIDADFRNPALGRTLDLAGRRGLAEILRGEATAEEVIVVVGGAGGFHFLPAGSPRIEPARLLEDGQLGRLLARARESFDLVIVDAPPVLPVPDALTLGRAVDGVVLVVRHDQSRYPMLERAGRRLAAVGVPVLGAVVVGVPGGDGTYDPAYAPPIGGEGRAL